MKRSDIGLSPKYKNNYHWPFKDVRNLVLNIKVPKWIEERFLILLLQIHIKYQHSKLKWIKYSEWFCVKCITIYIGILYSAFSDFNNWILYVV